MPVLFRDTPLGREIYEQAHREGEQVGRAEGIEEGIERGIERGRREALRAVVQLTGLMLRRTFGDDPRIDAIAERLADLPDADRIERLAAAASLGQLEQADPLGR